jgi:hypothetical protein
MANKEIRCSFSYLIGDNEDNIVLTLSKERSEMESKKLSRSFKKRQARSTTFDLTSQMPQRQI